MPRLTIEDKHTYNTIDQKVFETNFPNIGTPIPVPVVNKLKYPIAGTDEEERIGRKINSSSIMSEGYIYLNNELGSQAVGSSVIMPFYQAFYGVPETTVPQGYEVPGYLGRKAIASELDVVNSISYHFNPNMDNWNISIRHFVVEFDDNSLSGKTDGELRSYFRDWYQNLVIRTTNDHYPSNSMQVLRESTPFTGTFKILYDKTHHLTPSNKVLHYSYTIPYKRTLNFDAPGAIVPTNKYVLEVFIPPSDYKIDFGNLGFGNYIYDTALSSANITIESAYINSTLKLKFTDM